MLSEEALAVVREVNKKYGADSLVLGSDMAIPGRFTSGSVGLDVALGGGWPANQWAEIVGYESAGKTMLALKTIAANQALNPDYTAFWLAAEHYDEQQATALGVDNDRVVVAPTQELETGLEFVLKALESKAFHGIVIDSLPALISKEESEKEMKDSVVGVNARLFNKFWRKAGSVGKRDIRGSEPPFHGMIINQYREKIGVMYGDPKTSPGGNGKNYFFFARVEVKRLEYLSEKRPGIKDPVKVGQAVRFTIIKNKSAAPQQRALVDYYFRGAPFAGFRRGDYDIGKDFTTTGRLLRVVTGTRRWPVYRGDTYNGTVELEQRIWEDLDFRRQMREDILEVASNPALADQITNEEVDDEG